MKKSVMLLVPAALLTLGGCGGSKQDSPQSPAMTEAAAPKPAAKPAGPEALPGITVSDGVLLLPVIPGRPGAAYFALSNDGPNAVTIAAVTIAGAVKAEMHETNGGSMAPVATVTVNSGEAVRFERGGKHVMVFDLAAGVKAGTPAEMTLTFDGGDKISVPLKVQAMTGGMGDDMSGMAGMGHGDQH